MTGSLDRPPYYLSPRAAPFAHRPYERKRVRRDLHDARSVSVKLSAQERRRKAERRAQVEAQIVSLRSGSQSGGKVKAA